MQSHMIMERRKFLQAAGAGFLSMLGPGSADALAESDVVLASASMNRSGVYELLLFDDAANILSAIPLPARGHDVVFAPTQKSGVLFARRPGNFALAFDVPRASEPYVFHAPEGRHFYGHGAFSHDGKLLFAAENDYENAAGKVGIYDATDRYKRAAEFSSFGVGPHEVLVHPSKDILIVANGGIETHPDFGRAKLNIPTMRPNLSFIDLSSGDLLEQHHLGQDFHKLSIRHMDVTDHGRIVFGCQNQDGGDRTVPLVGSVTMGDDILLWDVADTSLADFANYVGSVGVSADGATAAVSLPKGNHLALFDVATGSLKHMQPLKECFGIASDGDGFIATTANGAVTSTSSANRAQISDHLLDNHLSVFEAV